MADVPGRRHPRSYNTTLIALLTHRSSLGDRAFPVTASRAWNSLPDYGLTDHLPWRAEDSLVQIDIRVGALQR